MAEKLNIQVYKVHEPIETSFQIAHTEDDKCGFLYRCKSGKLIFRQIICKQDETGFVIGSYIKTSFEDSKNFLNQYKTVLEEKLKECEKLNVEAETLVFVLIENK